MKPLAAEIAKPVVTMIERLGHPVGTMRRLDPLAAASRIAHQDSIASPEDEVGVALGIALLVTKNGVLL